MKSMKQIMQSPTTKPSDTPIKNSKNSGVRIEQVNKIFLKFSTFYGHLWRSQFKNDFYTNFARNEWVEALQNFDEKIIEQALDECLKKREMPPALAQFLECCRKLKRNVWTYKTAIHQPADPKIALTELQKIKTRLQMK